MIGSILGDIAGSTHEFSKNKRTDLPLFPPGSDWTDDTVLSVATASVLLHGGDYAPAYLAFGRRHPNPMGAYGSRFRQWLRRGDLLPYNSLGNGSAMRVGPVGWAFATLEETLAAARLSAGATHNHPEGVKGAQAVAAAIFLARNGSSKREIRDFVSARFGYDLSRTCDEIRPGYAFDVTCAGTVPQALAAFFDSSDFEDSLRLAVSLGGDADTLACITGGIAEAFYGEVPAPLREFARSKLPADLRAVTDAFCSRFVAPTRRP